MTNYPFDANFMPDNLRYIRTPDEPFAYPIGVTAVDKSEDGSVGGYIRGHHQRPEHEDG